MKKRDFYRSRSNNPDNPNKNICCLAVCAALGVDDVTHYLHTDNDILRATRARYTVRSCKSKIVTKRFNTVSRIRDRLQNIKGAFCFIAMVEGHVLLISRHGVTLIDSDPRQRDRRKVEKLYAVFL